MKKTVSLVIAIGIILALSACGGEEPTPTPASAVEAPAPTSIPATEPAPPAEEEEEASDAAPGPDQESETIVGIDPDDIFLNTVGIPYDWEASLVPGTPYDESQPPGPQGLPEHIQINFTSTGESQGMAPIMYIIPVDAYRQMWEENDNDTVSRTIDDVFDLAVDLPSPAPTSGMPVLPMERVTGQQDFAAQLDRASVAKVSASKNGFRFVGRFAQDMNPVTSDGLPLQYIYQGFTNDGEYLVAFFYEVTSSSLPTNEEVSEPFNTAVNNGQYEAFLAQQAAIIDTFPASAWEPDLTFLDDLIGSLTINDMPESGIQNRLWQLFARSDGQTEEPLGNTANYAVMYLPNGAMTYQADCNVGNGHYDVTGGVVGGIAMDLGASTMAECGPDSYANEMVANLIAAQEYLVHPGGNRMELVVPDVGSLVYVNRGAIDAPGDMEPEVGLPTPEADMPYGRVIAPSGVNVRTGPGNHYPVIGTAPYGAESPIIGRSADGEWWVVPLPNIPEPEGWASAAYVETTNTDNVPVVPAPAAPVPTAVPTSAVPATTQPPQATTNFWADSTTIKQGECTTLYWDVENIQAVWVYPQGEPYQQYPVTGQGSQKVCPETTTTYEMRVLHRDGTVELQAITIHVEVSDPLAKSSWQVVSLNGGAQVPIAGTTLTAVFGSSNDISGDSGCNTFNGSYTASGSSISIGPLATTQKMCQDEVNAQEQAYLTALQSATTYSITGSQLILYSSGLEVARFNRTG